MDRAFEDLPAQRVDALTLLVHHVVVFEEMFADGEVLRLDLFLGALDRARHHPVLDGNAFLHAETLHQTGDPVGSEDAHQVVFERQVEARGSRVSLPAGATAKLVVDAPRFVALGAEDVEAADVHDLLVLGIHLALEMGGNAFPVGTGHAIERVHVEEVDELLVVDELLLALGQLLGNFLGQALVPGRVLGVAAQQDVRAAAGHVRRDRHVVLVTGLRDDLGLLRVILGVQHDVPDAALLEQGREPLGLLDRDRADERRPA